MAEQNQDQNQNQPESQTKSGRPAILDEKKRRQVVAIHESNDLGRLLSSPPPPKPDYVARDKEGPKNEPFAPPRDCEDNDPDFAPGTDPLARQ
jgi:hypothetical protein